MICEETESKGTVVETKWKNILKLQKALLDMRNLFKNLSIEVEKIQRCLSEVELSENPNINSAYLKVGRIFIQKDIEECILSHKKKMNSLVEEGQKVTSDIKKLLRKIADEQTDLNEMMESDPLYCLKRAIVRTINFHHRVMIVDCFHWIVYNNSTFALTQQVILK